MWCLRRNLQIKLDQPVSAPAAAGLTLRRDGKPAGLLTSAVGLPDGTWIGLGLIKRRLADDQTPFEAGDAHAQVRLEGP